MSLDGFIATKDDDLSWLNCVAMEGEDYGYEAMLNRCDTYLVGRRTYDVVLKLTGGIFPQAERLNCFVLTKEQREDLEHIQFYNGDIVTLVNDLKSEGGKDIYCDGGASVIHSLMQQGLIDEYIISVIPVVLGDGIRLFKGGLSQCDLKLLDATSFDSGLVQLRYANTV